MPRLDAVFFPGGDGGTLVWPQLEAAAATIRKRHPHASIWVSAQELSRADLAAFAATINTPAVRAFLSGVVYGPHVELPLTEFVRLVVPPSLYPVRQYPDICHSLSAQLPVPRWHEAFKRSHGRQAINPMPRFSANIVRLRSNGSTPTAGVGAYSEGIHDDLNKCIWSAMAEDNRLTIEDAVRQYARYFFGRFEEQMTAVLLMLEANWDGDILTTNGIMNTLGLLQQVQAQATANELASNWRLQSLIYRGYYDAIIQLRYRSQVGVEAEAYAALADASSIGSLAATKQAVTILAANSASAPSSPLVKEWTTRALQLIADINESVGLEVLQSQSPTLNVEGLAADLTDSGWLLQRLHAVTLLPTEAARLDALQVLLIHSVAHSFVSSGPFPSHGPTVFAARPCIVCDYIYIYIIIRLSHIFCHPLNPVQPI